MDGNALWHASDRGELPWVVTAGSSATIRSPRGRRGISRPR